MGAVLTETQKTKESVLRNRPGTGILVGTFDSVENTDVHWHISY